MKQLAPSILSADFICLGEQLKQLQKLCIHYLHIDVMDGMFVPSISFGMPVIASLRKHTDTFFDVHLMIEEPIRYVNAWTSGRSGWVNCACGKRALICRGRLRPFEKVVRSRQCA